MPNVISSKNLGDDQKMRGQPLQPKFSHRPSAGSNPSSVPTPSINLDEPENTAIVVQPVKTVISESA